ncbi:DC-STAMP domain-containing protein 2-like isoform X2 [Pomacea canaliculata]|uniref:DC-STAMP domain-containing protein 2-like isoform X2 n=1 Tax=Pomacea canaliculata TaxID=400727 RepID=UPI000D731783|nr:DC-STAMP domain-containing protein 2-like isoform X2 [Pomacea canaliculata]
MSAWAAVKKALRVRRKMFRLADAKEDSLRELAGLPPRQTWCQNCWGGLRTICRMVVCRACCPRVCWMDVSCKELLCPRTTCWGRMFHIGTYENEVLKNCLGFVCGLVLTLLLYAWLSLQLDYSRKKAAIISCTIGFVLTLGLAFSISTRCLVLLTLPQMFSKQGRSFLLVYATVLVFTYPVSNFNRNLMVVADSATCGQSLMLNETQRLLQMVKDPLSAVIDSLEEMFDRIKRFADLLQGAFKALARAVKEIASAIAKVFKWLYNIVDICNEQMGEPYKKCTKVFDDAYKDCSRRLGVFDFVCGIVTATSHLCHIARIGELLCLLSAAIKTLVVDTIKEATIGTVMDLHEMFYFNVTMKNYFNYTMNQSRSYTEVKNAILADISRRLSVLSAVLTVVDNVMMVTITFVFIKAWFYRKHYLSSDSYDNYYVTSLLYEIDERRKQLGRDTLLPLKKCEETKYIGACSYLLTKKEQRKMLKGILFWAFGAYHAGFYLVIDYGLYWILAMITRHLAVKTTASLPAFLKLHVEGEGPMADMYRSMVNLLDPLASSDLDVDSSSCLPRPSRPDLDAYRTIVVLYVLTLVMAMLEAYGLRLRRVVAACYYPARERQRAVWLYNTILLTRGAFFKFTRRQLRRKFKNDTEIQKLSVRSRLVRQCPALGRLLKFLGYDRKMCLLCGAEGRVSDMDNFIHCSNHGCEAVYCQQCYDDLNNLCTVCMNPVDYGDISDASEEIQVKMRMWSMLRRPWPKSSMLIEKPRGNKNIPVRLWVRSKISLAFLLLKPSCR